MFLGSSWYKPGYFLKTEIIKNYIYSSPGAHFMRKKKEMISGNT